MEVGVRELKQHLSGYLDQAERGEPITVTERGRPKVMIVPIAGGDRLEQAVEEGWVRPPSRTWRSAPRRFASELRISDALDEDRSE